MFKCSELVGDGQRGAQWLGGDEGKNVPHLILSIGRETPDNVNSLTQGPGCPARRFSLNL